MYESIFSSICNAIGSRLEAVNQTIQDQAASGEGMIELDDSNLELSGGVIPLQTKVIETSDTVV